MNAEILLKKIAKIRVFSRDGERAPHKPLLLLLALANLQSGKPRLISYSETAPRLLRLIQDFGPSRSSYKPEYPFWYLVSDGLWDIPDKINLFESTKNKCPSKKEISNIDPAGGLPAEIYDFLKNNPKLMEKLADSILEQHFPESLHEDILSAVGFEKNQAESVNKKQARDPEFRNRILTIYQYRCAICGFDLRLGNTPICLEAAHIKWHQAGGPAVAQNGLALCSLHHKLFDRGAFTIDQSFKIKVSEHVNGSNGVEEWLHRYSGHSLKLPLSTDFYPSEKFTSWHVKEVFKAFKV